VKKKHLAILRGGFLLSVISYCQPEVLRFVLLITSSSITRKQSIEATD